ncbi:hypothetical protein FRUB_01647 [Fimbriiglobus ruber]|uniref:Uncharacterized protein n=1 Tax=Fimbriiglobus ruber TaxID=1908690 RepID=A0A225E5D5_9BACT|nr:hypothetical protein FRUB_01647 [Fimbriiglobus ruber]
MAPEFPISPLKNGQPDGRDRFSKPTPRQVAPANFFRRFRFVLPSA